MNAQPLLSGADYQPLTTLKSLRDVFVVETIKLWRIAGLIVLNLLCIFGVNSITLIFVGHLGELELSAVSIALLVVGTFVFGFLLGMGSALETLCGQAFGAGHVNMLGIYLQRSWIILLSTSVLLLPLYVFATPILKILGQADDIAELAGKFAILTIPRGFALAINFPTQKFLQAQSKVLVLAWIGLVALVAHAAMTWCFVFKLNLGLLGAAMAYNVTYWLISIAQVAYIVFWLKDGWSGLSWVAFKDLWAFVRLSFASAVMLCLEVWYLMSVVIVTGNLNNSEIAIDALSVCLNFNGIEVMVFIGINAAISVRVSNELGRGRPRAAKYSVYVTVFQSFIIGLICMIGVLIAKDYIAILFTNSEAVRIAASKLAFLLGITMVLNSVQPVLSGVAVGGGWQATVAYINVGCYYIFGLPLGVALGYIANLGVAGIWGGMIAGLALQTLLLLIVIYRTNWEKEVEQSAERLLKWGGQQPRRDVDNS